MQVLLVEFRIKPGFEAAFARAITANAKASLAQEPGCRQFDVCAHPADPAHVVLYELYDDELAVQAHLASAHFLQMNAATAHWVLDKRVWRGTRAAP
jgi:quinol monooxygenase YgiN